MTKHVIKMAAVLAIVACVCAAPVQAGPIVPPVYGIDSNGMTGVPTQLKFSSADGSHWNIRDNQGRPLYLYYSPGAGPLEKILTGADFTSDQFTLTEYLYVNQGQPWTDWHEQFVTPSFVWTGNPILSIDSTGDQYAGTISPDGTQVDFFFLPSSLAPGTAITINKQFKFVDAGLPPPDTIVIDQWPTVPEPGTFALLAAGLIGVLVYAWRKRK